MTSLSRAPSAEVEAGSAPDCAPKQDLRTGPDSSAIETGSSAAAETRRFMDLEIEILPDVLAPREETEILARAVVGLLGRWAGRPRVLDMCCGTGNLACAVASAFPSADVWACDLTASCCAAARRNAERLGFAERVHVLQGDLFEPLADMPQDGFDLVMCNPPYISTGRLDGDKSYLLQSEPREAFDGGPYGLTIHQRVINEAWRHLRPDGWLALEFGLGQERQVATLFRRAAAYGAPDYVSDVAGAPRVAVARRSR